MYEDDYDSEQAYVRHRAGERVYPCPTCKEEGKLSARDKQNGYQCDDCANREDTRHRAAIQ